MKNCYALATYDLLCCISEERQKAIYEGFSGLLSIEKGEPKETAQAVPDREETNPYEASGLMRMLGKQSVYTSYDSEVYADIREIADARGYGRRFDSVFDLILDVFLYGCIKGKRMERAKKKATTQTTK